jgi:hypothetical protein
LYIQIVLRLCENDKQIIWDKSSYLGNFSSFNMCIHVIWSCGRIISPPNDKTPTSRGCSTHEFKYFITQIPNTLLVKPFSASWVGNDKMVGIKPRTPSTPVCITPTGPLHMCAHLNMYTTWLGSGTSQKFKIS